MTADDEAAVTACGRDPLRHPQTCIEALASGWISSDDLCSHCTRLMMFTLDRVAGPLPWHENFIRRARSTP